MKGSHKNMVSAVFLGLHTVFFELEMPMMPHQCGKKHQLLLTERSISCATRLYNPTQGETLNALQRKFISSACIFVVVPLNTQLMAIRQGRHMGRQMSREPRLLTHFAFNCKKQVQKGGTANTHRDRIFFLLSRRF